MKPVWRPMILLALLLALAFSTAQSAHSQPAKQADTVIPPRVIATTPAQREIASPGTTIEIDFDQAMDRPSVESALSIDPKVDGKIAWTDDMTLTFTPSAPLQRGQEVHVTIGTGAKSIGSVALDDPFTLVFQVVPPLAVSQVIPAPDAQNVEAGGTITVVFNRPVVPLVTTGEQSGLPQPLTFSPAVEGKGEWDGTAIYTFRPTKAFAGGTTYTVTVSGDIKDVDGNPLDKPYSWKFSTIAPQWQYISPNNGQTLVPLESPISVQFNQPMDPASTQAAFTLRNLSTGADVAGTFKFGSDGSSFVFTPASKLELGRTYQIALRSGAKSASGDATLTNPTTSIFTAVPYPQVVQTYPQNGQKIPPGQGLSIQFNTIMDEKSFAGRVHVDPKPDNVSISGGGTSLYVGFNSLPATTYTVTLDAGASDPYGNTIKEPTVVTFTTTDLPPSLGLATRDIIAVTSAYRADTTMIASTINVSQLNVNLSTLELPEFLQLVARNNGYPYLYNWQPPRITRSWTQPVENKPNTQSLLYLKLGGDQGGQLPPGVYYFDVNAPELQRMQPSQPPRQQLLIVSTAALTTKVTPGEFLVWVTDLKSGKPVPAAHVKVYDLTGQVVVSGDSDGNGLFRGPVPASVTANYPNTYWISAEGDKIFALSSTNWQDNFQPYPFDASQDFQPRKDMVYLYTDQPVYRPGHPVYFRGIVRNLDDVTYTAPAGAGAEVVINDAQGKEIYRQKVTLNNYGAFSGKYEPPQDAAVGGYNLSVLYNQQTFYLGFSVAEFRPPEFLVATKAQASEVVAGDTIKVDVDSTFYFGGPVSGGKVTWVALANQGYFNYTGDGYYDFSSNTDYVYNRQVGAGNGTLDDKGHFEIQLPADLGGSPNQQVFTIEATVTDINNQAISGRTTVTVHPATVYVGLQPAAYVGTANKPLDVNVIVVDWASKPQPGQNVNLTVVERRWEQDPNTLNWSQKSVPVTDGKVTTDDKGKAVFTFTPTRAGVFEIQAQTRDPRERIAQSSTTVWVQGSEFVPWNNTDKALHLVADKKQYNPGDTANILIPSPFPEPVQALVTVERAGIMKTDVVTITGSYTYQLPIDAKHSPNVYVAVTLMRGSGDQGLIPELRYGLVNLPVSVKQQLKVKITPSTAQAKPGDTVKFDIEITDLDGKPVAAEIGLSMSDLANLSVGAANSQKIFDYFWSPHGLSVMTSGSLSRLIDDLTIKDVHLETAQTVEMAAGGALTAAPTQTASANAAAPAAADGVNRDANKTASEGQQQVAAPRTNFVDTPLWLPNLATDTSGHAVADVTLPDNLTTWRLDARAISADTYVGDASLDVVSTKPLLVRPSTPRFFVVGDETELAVVVNNNTDQDLPVQVALDAKGVTLKADAKQTVNIPKAGRVRVAWVATVGDVENVDLTFSAVSGEYNDASKPAVGLGDQRLLPVYRYEAPDYVSTAGTLRNPGTRTEAVRLPSATLAPTGELILKLNPSLAATTLDGLDYLKNYPYQCIEQTVSRFLPNVITFRALQKLNLDKPELRAQLDAAVKYALGRLKTEQHDDGGWGWFPNDESNPLTSTYALLGLVEAKASDLGVDEDMFNRAVEYVMSTLRPVDDNTPFWQLNRTAFTLYVLAQAKNPNPSLMDALLQRREKMNLYARAFLAQAYHFSNGDPAKTNTLVSDLQSAAVVSATGIHWEEKYRDWWNWDSDTRTTAIVLKTLVDLTPQSDLIPNIVRWLMVARRGDAWETTQETAWSVMALTDWMDVSGELKADYSYSVQVNGKALGDGKANADTLRDTKTLQISVGDMLRDQINKIVVDHGAGPGALYYTATLHVNQPVELIKPTNRGFAFTRTYYLNGKPVTSAKVGEVLTVSLEITVANDMYYANINDPIPAGAELVDTSLQTTSQVGQAPELDMIDPWYRGWGWWWFSNTELRTEKIVLSATYLPRGTYRFVYQIRASSPGTYRVIPANGQEFYFPEVFGRGEGSLFTITAE